MSRPMFGNRMWGNRRDDPPVPIRWTPDLVDRFWNGFSQTRLTAFSFSLQAGRSLLVAIDHHLPREGRILDFGAGDGDLVRLLCDRGLRAAAYEPSPERARRLQQKLQGYPGFLGLIDETSRELFDVVIMAEVIEHVLDEELDACLRRLGALTRPGGLVAITTPNNEDLELGMAYCPISNTLFHRWQHVRSFTEHSLSELLGRYGFDKVVVHHVEFKDSLFIPHDRIWGGPQADDALPSHLVEMRANRPVRMAGESNLLYIGRRCR